MTIARVLLEFVFKIIKAFFSKSKKVLRGLVSALFRYTMSRVVSDQ